MKKLWAAIKNNPDVTGYVILTLLIFGACFAAELAFLAGIYVFIFAFFLRKEEKIIGLILFVYSFFIIFEICDLSVDIAGVLYYMSFLFFILDILKLAVFLLYLLRVIKKEKKLNLKMFIPLIIFLIYIALPVHNCGFVDFGRLTIAYLALYVVYEIRNEINFLYLVRVFAFGIILSAILGLYYKISPFLASYMHPVRTESGKIRYQGLMTHPLQMAAFALIAIAALLFMKHKKKISLLEFFLLFIPIFIFGYMSVSRTFVITIAVSLVVYAVLELIQSRQKLGSLFFIGSLLVVIGIIAIIFLDQTKDFLLRFDAAYYDSYIPGIEEEGTFDEFLAGNIPAALNRQDLIKYYTMDWSSSIQTILFGRGISSRAIGGLNAHNILVQRLWEHGIVGFLLYLVIFVCSINWKKLKNIKYYLSTSIIFIPFFLFLLVEIIYFDFVGMVLVLASLGVVNNLSPEKQNAISIGNLDADSTVLLQANNDEGKIKLNDIKLSIVIPVYNGEKFIKSCIDKVLQIDLNKEIIVINDGSIDQSLELLQAYGEKIVLINLHENKGVSHARNLGVEYATGDFIAFIDIDDDFELDMHSKILTKMLKNDADVGMCQYDDINLNGKKITRTGRFLNYENLEQADVIRLNLLNRLNNTVWVTIYKSELAKSVKFEEQIKIGEDRLYLLRIALKAQKTVFVNEDLYHYIKNPTSATNSEKFLYNVESHTRLLEYLTDREKEILSSQFSKEFEFCRHSMFFVSFNMVLRCGSVTKVNNQDKKMCLRKFLEKDFCNYYIKSKYAPLSNRIECFFVKFLGLNLFLFFFPFFHFLWRGWRRFKNYINSINKKNKVNKFDSVILGKKLK